MSVTSGFFNSLNHDRRYNAQQMSSIFDGVINDGVFANIGVAFKATAAGGVTVDIGEGKAWFNSAWVYNDTVLPLTFEASEVVLDRIDAIVIDVDHNESVRSGTIKIVKGTPSSSPKRPTMVSDKKHKQAPLVYIYRKAGTTEITQADITNMVGTSECPYITGILQVQNIDNIVAQWNAQWNQWYAEKTAETDSDASELLAEMKSEFDIWFAYVQALMSEKIVEADSDTSELLAKMKSEFDSWFDDFKSVLDEDVAASLAAKVADLMAKFDTLAKEGAVYDEIEDSDLDEILGSDGTPIQGKTIIGSGSSGSVDLSEPMSGNLDMNGYRVMNVPDPEQDDDAANAGYVKMVSSKASSPRNLLDNSDFRNPVNQRGFVSGALGANDYCIDRWLLQYNTSITMMDGFIRLGGQYNFWQILPITLRAGKTYTCVAKVKASNTSRPLFAYIRDADGNGVASVGNPTIGAEWTVCSMTLTPKSDIANAVVEVHQSNVAVEVCTDIEWIALYEGEYTIDTLPEYQPKGYENELLVCRQYDLSTGEYIGLRKFGYAHNLLDNSDFRNPVNQRGFVSGAEGFANYTIDRWKLQYSTLMGLESDSISLWGHWSLWQPINRKIRAGEKYTLAVECKGETGNERFDLTMQSRTSGVQFKHTENNIGTDWKIIAAVFTAYQDLAIGDVSFAIELNSNDGQPTKTFIRWAAFYEGEYTIDTLPEYQAKGYGAELAECQRYLQRFRTADFRKTYCEDFRPTMRMTDTGVVSDFELTIDGIMYYFSSAEL